MSIPEFQIVDHRLVRLDQKEIPFVNSPNQSGEITPQFLIIHYTSGRSASSSIDWFANPVANASAHLVISRKGEITQMVDFNKKAWHAGKSEWNNLEGMNQHSIGIELDNAGRLMKQRGKWVAWFGKTYPNREVVEAKHKHEETSSGWHNFPQKQIDAAIGASMAIVRHYGLSDVLGHDDISPIRKVDPGPAFPMLSFRSIVMGRHDDEIEVFETIENLNIRMGPGTRYEPIAESPLPKGTHVIILDVYRNWKYVEALQELDHHGFGIKGWVSGKYLRQLPVG